MKVLCFLSSQSLLLLLRYTGTSVSYLSMSVFGFLRTSMVFVLLRSFLRGDFGGLVRTGTIVKLKLKTRGPDTLLYKDNIQ